MTSLLSTGLIPECPYMDCGFVCCDIDPSDTGNFIAMYPGELEAATESTAHLRVIDDDYHGGTKVVCEASTCATCDDGYKPFDCAVYPVWPRNGEPWIRGSKCPLLTDMLAAHIPWVTERFDEFSDPVKDWFNKVEMVGYASL